MRILLLSLLFFTSYITIFFSISNLVFVSGRCLNDQRQLLLELSFVSSSNTTVTSSWKQTVDCCSWDGVSCDAGGRVIGLDLSSRSISRAIDDSSSLFRLKHLQRLNLASNSFMSTFPSRFDKFGNLSYLNLSYAGFAGQIPDGISRLTRLVTLDLSTSTSSSELEKPNLETLVQNLTRLRFLYLDGINIAATGKEWCQALSRLTELQVLSMSGCGLSGPIHSSLSKLRSLSVILLDNNNLSASVPRFFAEFQNLTSLSMVNSSLLGRLPEEILQIPTLQTLDLSNNELLQGWFPNFPLNASLKTLSLGDTSFGGQVPESIGNLEQLTRIELGRCNFSGPIPSFSSLRNLRVVKLANNQLSGTLHSTVWSGLSKLLSIDLSGNKLSGTIPPTMFGIPSLQELDLSQNQFNGSIGDFDGNASLLLSYLDISGNNLQGQLPRSRISVTFFKQLEWFDPNECLSESEESFRS
ncbi:hypothetical protein GQ457_12G003590 [Hibiscus cannabinus]